MAEDSDPPVPGSPHESDEGTFADVMNSFSFGSRAPKKRGRRHAAEPGPEAAPVPGPGPGGSAELTDPSLQPVALPEMEDSAAAVRPYAWTRGRTRSEIQLELETLISTSDHGRQQARTLSEEHYTITTICQHPRSVAEVAALLAVPIGVARVLVGDMAESGFVIVHRTASMGDDHLPNLDLMERVLSGLRRL